jgi:1-deoxy-D-xylulose-5-phosphate reductoisomerase
MKNGEQKNVVLLGATGSIGQSACKVVRAMPGRLRLAGISAHSNHEQLAMLAREFGPRAACLACDLPPGATPMPQGVKFLSGDEGLIELATMPEADIVLVAIVGTDGLAPALAAIRAGKDLAVASKEILVMAGGIVMREAARHGVKVLPVDSEHNAIFQCLEGCNRQSPGRDPATCAQIRRLVLTCSGGPFRELPASEFSRVTPEMALRHPTWTMGQKITVDSATLFNKGLEMIEAHWLFQVPMDRIEAVIHPQSIVHSLVEFVDGSMLAQLSHTDMAFPIQYALTYPDRVPGALPPLDLVRLGRLDFSAPRRADFPALDLAMEAGTRGGTLPAVLNAANEIAVAAFLVGRCGFPDIWKTVASTMDRAPFLADPSLEELIAVDKEARALASNSTATVTQSIAPRA